MNLFTRFSDWRVNLSPRQRFCFRFWLLTLALVVFAYHFWMPLKQVPLELPVSASSAQAKTASLAFWEVFHGNDTRRERVDEAIAGLTAAFEKHPDDPILTALLGGAHLWRYQLRNVYGLTAAELEADLLATQSMAKQTIALEPGVTETTAPSMLATAAWQLAVLEDEPMVRSRVHLNIMDNSFLYPQFASFIQGWLLAAMLEAGNEHYPQSHLGYDFMLDACAGFMIPKDMKFTKLSHTLYGIKIRLLGDATCYNNPIAPHNIEGTFFVMGDSWLKYGDLDRARLWYENVKTAPTYATWQYQEVLEDRLANLEKYRDKFRRESGTLDVSEPAMNFQSEISCGICHTQ